MHTKIYRSKVTLVCNFLSDGSHGGKESYLERNSKTNEAKR